MLPIVIDITRGEDVVADAGVSGGKNTAGDISDTSVVVTVVVVVVSPSNQKDQCLVV